MSVTVLRPGDMCGPYEIVRELGRGGMAIVYLGRGPEGEARAIKTLEFAESLDDGRMERFRREVRLLSSLDHVNVVRFFEAGRHRGTLVWMALEYLEGPTLRDIIDERGGRVPVADQLRWCKHVADGVAAAHGLRVIHRDLKPSNVAVVRDVAKVFDFNISKFRRWGAKLTDHAARLGTIGYMAPEQLDSGEVDERTDVYALGILLHELASGEHPMVPRDHSWTAMEIVSRCLLLEPAPLDRLVPGYPRDAAAIAQKALSKDPAARFQSMGEMREALDDALRRYLKERRPLAVQGWSGDWNLPASLEPAALPTGAAAAGLDVTILLGTPPVEIDEPAGVLPTVPLVEAAPVSPGWQATVPLPPPPPAPPATTEAPSRWGPRLAGALAGALIGTAIGLLALPIANLVAPPARPAPAPAASSTAEPRSD